MKKILNLIAILCFFAFFAGVIGAIWSNNDDQRWIFGRIVLTSTLIFIACFILDRIIEFSEKQKLKNEKNN